VACPLSVFTVHDGMIFSNLWIFNLKTAKHCKYQVSVQRKLRFISHWIENTRHDNTHQRLLSQNGSRVTEVPNTTNITFSFSRCLMLAYVRDLSGLTAFNALRALEIRPMG
jgi:hypothetical protein